MIQLYHPPKPFIYSVFTPDIITDTADDVLHCTAFWDRGFAVICWQWIWLVTTIPLGLAVFVTLYHALRALIPYRPRWTKPFVEEEVHEPNGLKLVYRRRLSWQIYALVVLPLCAILLQIIGGGGSVFDKVHGGLNLALTWALTLVLVLIVWPRTASISLLVVYTAIAIVQANILNGTSYVDVDIKVSALKTSRVVVPLLAAMVIMTMPLRDPVLPSNEISPAFGTPSNNLRSPEDKLTLWQFLSVSWMSPLIATGIKRQLDNGDVWLLGYEFQHRRLHDTFRELRGSVIQRLLRANVIDLAILSGLAIVELVSTLSVPILLQQLLKSMENPITPRSSTITYAVLTLVVSLVSAQSGVLSLWYGRRCYERSRGEMITMLYEKTLNRKIVGAHKDSRHETKDSEEPQSSLVNKMLQKIIAPFRRRKVMTEQDLNVMYKESASMGKILNLMRNDVYEVAQRFWEFQSLITKPLGLILSIILLWQFIGWSCLIGVFAVLVGQVLNALFARALLYYERIRRTATDEKLKKVTQFVESIRHLRWYGWQDTWCKEIMDARQVELGLRIVTGLWNILIAFTNALAGVMFPVAAFWAYTALMGKQLRVDIAFPALQVFGFLDNVLRDLPGLITVLLNARVAVGRIEDFMQEPDKDGEGSPNQFATGNGHSAKPTSLNIYDQLLGPIRDEESDEDVEEDAPVDWVEFKHASFAWPGSYNPVLRNVSLYFPVGLTVVCGQVGAGKTALLQAILGELDHLNGHFRRSDEMVGYCAQTPWLQSMSIRDNILFSEPYHEERYKSVLDACALTTDMAGFKHGDLSNIGENGIGLSGGQRARVALARAVYSRAKILLLDDPISALDHQTAEFIIEKCLKGKLMDDRTVILVTHRTELCRGLAAQLLEIIEGEVHILDPEERPHTDIPPTSPEETESKNDEKTSTVEPNKFIEDEHRTHGGVKRAVYWEYIKAGKLQLWFLLILSLALARLANVAQTWFLKSWGEAYNTHSNVFPSPSNLFDNLPAPDSNIKPWLIVYLLTAIVKAIIFFINQCFMLIIVYSTGKQMFGDVVQRVAHTTFRFYDVTPVGRLMNRLTSDINTIDGNISTQFSSVALLCIMWITSLVVIASVTPIFLIFSLSLTIAFVAIFLRFLPTSQSLRRLEMVSLSPLMSNFGALLEGLTTVRAFNAQHRFQDRVISVTDDFQKMDHFYWSLQSWLMYRFDILSAVSTLVLTLIAIYTGVSSGLTAFVLIAASQFVDATHALCRRYGQLEMDFVSVERVVELLHVEQEPIGSIDPPAWWPSIDSGIVFEDVTIRYAPHLEPALSDVNLTIRGGKSTAIIGRTGSGKSTLAMALLSTVRPEKGRILVDGIDLALVNTQKLRERVTFVAQDPVLFPGSMRQNLDPLSEFSDEECSSVLSKICGKYNWTLETNIEAQGRNLSQGQRQLIGLARVLLRRSAIVILDEATASIDYETAQVVQSVLREEMGGRTVVSIAHRVEVLRGVEDCVVLSKGRVVENGPVEEVLKKGMVVDGASMPVE